MRDADRVPTTPPKRSKTMGDLPPAVQVVVWVALLLTFVGLIWASIEGDDDSSALGPDSGAEVQPMGVDV